jgi:hypothetical protein
MIEGGGGRVVLSAVLWLGAASRGCGDGDADRLTGEPDVKSPKGEPFSLSDSVGELAADEEEEEVIEDASDISESSLIFVCSVTLLCMSVACSASWSALIL